MNDDKNKLTLEQLAKLLAEIPNLKKQFGSKEIEFFFENPNMWDPNRTVFSILYLLRRDIITCLGKDPTTGEETKYKVLWPGAMSILAGIDLLAKFYYGSETYNEVRKRFMGFVQDYFSLGIDECEIIFQLRNSLLHSFGLYSYKQKGSQRVEYKFGLTASNHNLISQTDEKFYRIDILTLAELFEKSIYSYKNELLNDMNLKKNFLGILPHYGSTIMKEFNVFPFDFDIK